MTGKRSNLTRYLVRSLLAAAAACAVILLVSAIWARAHTRRYVVMLRFTPDDGQEARGALEDAARIVEARLQMLARSYALKDCEVQTAPQQRIRVTFRSRFDPSEAVDWITMTGLADFCLLHPDMPIVGTMEPEDVPEGYEVKVYKELRYSLSRPGAMTEYEHRYLVCKEAMMRVKRFAGVHFATAGLKKETVLTFELEEAQGEQFKDLTALNVGRMMALLIDGGLFFPPKQIPSAIEGGAVQMRGYFYNVPLRKLVRMLSAGTVPGRLEVESARAE